MVMGMLQLQRAEVRVGQLSFEVIGYYTSEGDVADSQARLSTGELSSPKYLTLA